MEMKKSVLVSAVLLAVNGQVFAESQLNLDDVIVTATRTPQSREAVIADVSVITAEEIERSGQSTLVELLRLQHGVEISQTGGAGQSSALFMRGTNSNHVVVLIDGMRLNSATLGTTTLENIQLSQIERIEVLRGPATSLYGQDAIGGVVQLFTKKGVDGFHPHFNIGYGSFGTRLAEAGVHGKFEDTSYAVSLSGKKVDGFSALEQELAIINDDDAYRSWQLAANVSQKLAEGHEIGLQIFNSDGKVEYDNRFNATDFNSRTYMVQQAFSAFSKNQFTEGWLSTLRVGLSRDRQKNYDESPVFSRFDTEQTQINWQNDLKLPVGTLTLMYDRLEDEVTSSTDFSTKSRVNDGLVASYIGTLGAHTLQASYRNDQNEQYGHYDTGNLGYGYQVSSVLKVSANIGTALKAPTFNDLYFPFSDFGSALVILGIQI
jgi:vitamin B12 transporter